MKVLSNVSNYKFACLMPLKGHRCWPFRRRHARFIRMELILDTGEFPVPEGLEERYKALLKTTFDRLKVEKDYEVDCSYVGDEEMQVLNKNYRGLDRPTDVLSFAFNEGDDKAEDMPMAPGERPILGDIVIDFEQACRQAKEIGNTDFRELSFLFTHGLLHILGYDHMKEEDAKVMFALQDEILSEVEKNG